MRVRWTSVREALLGFGRLAYTTRHRAAGCLDSESKHLSSASRISRSTLGPEFMHSSSDTHTNIHAYAQTHILISLIQSLTLSNPPQPSPALLPQIGCPSTNPHAPWTLNSPVCRPAT